MRSVNLAIALLGTMVFAISGCSSDVGEADLIWAMNVGGEGFVSIDGTEYVAEAYVTGGDIGRLETVKGSQDAPIYQSYRAGNVHIDYPVADGVYDLTLKFAEPDDIGGGERLFDAYAEDRIVIRALDIMASRDGKVRSALSVTIPNIDINDGVLNVRFEASVNEAVLNAVVLRRKGIVSKKGRLVWSDEFDVDGEPDLTKWSFNIWPARKVNDEDQAYTSRRKNVRIDDGRLIIEAHKEEFGNATYTSGRIHSAGKGDFLHGRFEVRARLPAGKGSWPAIWMLPSDPYRYSTTCEVGEDWQGSPTCDAWPNSGEIDIMEHVGYQMDHVHGTVHTKAYYWAEWEQRKGRFLANGVDQSFHVYALEWSPTDIRAFVDDTLYFVYTNENNGWQTWPFDQPFHLILNVAVGGMWGRSGGGIDDEIFPLRMEVDYVRVYELSGD